MKSIISPLHKNVETLSATVVHSERTTSKGASRILKRLATLLLFIAHSLICMDGHCMTRCLWIVLFLSPLLPAEVVIAAKDQEKS